MAELGKLSGLEAVRYTVEWIRQGTATFLEEGPVIIKEAGVDALLVDQISNEGAAIADLLDIPFVTICSAVVLNRDITIPPFNTLWPYSPAWWAKIRNKLGYNLINRLTAALRETLTEYRQKNNLPVSSNPNDNYSKLAQISHQPAEFEFPRKTLPPWFHFTGPYHNSITREPAPFPWEKLTEKPLIYASMGTIQNQLLTVFQDIATACADLDAQLVISLGGSAEPDSLPNLPGSPLVVKYAPQLEILPKTTLTITHAGLNTTLECLTRGVPMVAIPITNDQPGVSSRIAWTGTGEVVPLKRLNADRLKVAVKKVLQEDSYKKNALRLQDAIEKAGGVKRAADIIEEVVATGKPVLAAR